MNYTYYQRGKCIFCGDIMWTNHRINGVVCPGLYIRQKVEFDLER